MIIGNCLDLYNLLDGDGILSNEINPNKNEMNNDENQNNENQDVRDDDSEGPGEFEPEL